MCSGSKEKVSLADLVMEGELKKQISDQGCKFSVLLELSAANDVNGLRKAVEEEGLDVDEASFWYGRAVGSKKMGLQERTPLMISAMFGCGEVVKFILSTGLVDVNRACGSDGATALHCAAEGGSAAALEVVKLLIDSKADVNSVDASGRRPGDVIVEGKTRPAFNSIRKNLEILLKGSSSFGEEWVFSDEIVDQHDGQQLQTPRKDGSERKEYPVDLSMPDIKNGIYGSDEFRMYTFKVKPCSRAYSHDWTECPFVHPGENARRRDPRKYHYSCVPCPEFRKGSCRQGDACEYAHGVFECWLHPAQYRTRLCKDETGCTRRVCFFAHRPEELRPLYASTGSAVPSPRSSSNNSSLDMSAMSPLALGSSSIMMLSNSTPPMSPSVAASSPMGGAGWQSQSSLVPPMLQLPGSRLKSALSARDMELDMDLLGFDAHHNHRQQQSMMDEISSMSSPTSWSNSMASVAALAAASSGGRTGDYGRLGGVRPTNLDDVFASLDPSMLSQFQGLGMKASSPQMNSPTGLQMRPNINQQLRSSYPSNHPSSPVRSPSAFSLDPSSAAALMNSRSAAFAKRSQSFIDRGAMNRHLVPPSSPNSMVHPFSSDWGSPNGKLDWGIQGEELNKLRKSASFGIRSSNEAVSNFVEPDVSWVQSDGQQSGGSAAHYGSEESQQQQYRVNSSEMLSPWGELLYMEQEQLVA